MTGRSGRGRGHGGARVGPSVDGRARPVRPHPASVAALLGAGALLAGSSLLPLTARGPGASMASLGLADLVLGGSLGSLVNRWYGLAGYLAPVAGGLLLLQPLVGRRGHRWTGWLAVAGGAVAAVLNVLLLSSLDVAPGAGSVMVLAGAPLGAVAWVLTLRGGGLGTSAPVTDVERRPNPPTTTPPGPDHMVGRRGTER